MRKTKIVCTIGPASEDKDTLRKLIKAGLNVVRLNFSHGDHEEHGTRVQRVNELREELNEPISLLLDTKGPEIRTGNFDVKDTMLEEGSEVVIRHDDVPGTSSEFSVSYKQIHEDLSPGKQVLLDDGLVALEVTEIRGKDVVTKVLNSGPISSHKSVNLPNVNTQLPALTEKDEADIAFAVEHDFDYIAASFVRKAADVIGIRNLLKKLGGEDIQIISKIENQEGVDNYRQILAASDGIMVARGDLGVEIPVQEVPAVQKWMIKLANEAHKPIITATQMLDSMIRQPRPTRAEVSDVANAIMDGTSAIMLSGESANGKYPVEAVEMMASIATTTEGSIDYWGQFRSRSNHQQPSVGNAIAHATSSTAMDLNAKAILTVTQSGRTARLIASNQPACPIIVTTSSPKVRTQMSLVWGTVCLLVEPMTSTDELFDASEKLAMETGLVSNGDVVVITGGTPLGMAGTTNTLKVLNIGDLLSQGTGVGSQIVSGEVQLLPDERDLESMPIRKGAILVSRTIEEDEIDFVRDAGAIIVESSDPDSPVCKAAPNLNLPVVYGCQDVTSVLKDGSVVTVDAGHGTIS